MERLGKISKLWWTCLALFILHQVLEKIAGIHLPFIDSFLDPLLSIPIILGIHLYERRYIFREGPSFTLPLFEVLIISVALAIFFEIAWPRWFEGFVYDPWDFVAYGLGALCFWFIINLPSAKS